MTTTRVRTAVLSLVLSLSISLHAADVADNRWVSVGPESEPTIHSLAIHPSRTRTIWAGGIGEIWRTEDGGKSWVAAETPEAPCEVRALVMHPSEPATLYAGCVGVIRSTDSGRTWTSTGEGIRVGELRPVVWAIAIDPSDPATIYAGTPHGVIFKTVDSGAHWQPTGALPSSVKEIRSLAIDAASPRTIYAAATRGGVFKSVDGGTSWLAANSGLPMEVTSLAIDSRSPATLYAGTIDRGIFKTTDGGSSWTEIYGSADAGTSEFTIAELAIDPFTSSTLYAAMGNANLGVIQTTDGGATWRSIETGMPFYAALRALAISPGSPSSIFIGSTDQYPGIVDGGIFAAKLTSRCPQTVATGITEFAVPTAASKPLGITEGPDCALWFTEADGNKIGRITTDGQITEFAIPTAKSNPSRIVTGADGALWFTEADGNKIGRITIDGAITEFPIATAKSFPVGIAAGSDGNIWFTQMSAHSIGRITPAGVITEFLIPPVEGFGAIPLGIAAGADGHLWFSEYFTGRFGRVTTDGVVTVFRVEPLCCASLSEIALGPDGNMWSPEEWHNKVVRIGASGTMTTVQLPTAGFEGGGAHTAYGMAAGADGAMWYTQRPATIGRITMAGVATEVQTPTPGSAPVIITRGPDGHMWFTELTANKIGRIAVTAPAAVPVPARRRAAGR